MIHELSIGELGGDRVLSGEPRGQLFLGRLISTVRPQLEAAPLFLNFQDVDLMTSSFFRASILPFREYSISKLNLYPVLANLSEDTLDEVNVVIGPIRDAVLTCKLSSRGAISEAKVFGMLEDKQRLTLDAVIAAKEADASRLKDQSDKTRKGSSDEIISLTGWNNRLAALVTKGLLIETKRGKGKLYRPVLEFGYGR